MRPSPELSEPGTTIRLQGEYDVARTAELRRQLLPHVNQVVLVDTSDVSFIDSSGLAVLLDAATEARSLGGAVRVVQPSTVVRALVEITGTAEELGL